MGDHTSDRMLWISIPVKPSRSAGERRAFNNTRNSGIRLVLLDSERCYDDAAASSVDLVGGSISACPMIGRNRTEESDESAALQLKDGILPFSHELQISDRFLQETMIVAESSRLHVSLLLPARPNNRHVLLKTCDHPQLTFLILGQFQFHVRIDCCEFEQQGGRWAKLGGMRKPKGCSHSSAVNSGSTARRPHFSNGDLF